jgi:antitoxin Phd
MIGEIIMGQIWQLQEAKNKFSKLVEKALSEGPQFVTKHGKEAVVILSVEDYQKIVKPKSNLFHFIRSSSLSNISIDTERDKSVSRDIEL